MYTSVDKKGRDKEVEVHLDERDPVYMGLRGLELHKVSERIEREVSSRREKAVPTKKVCGCCLVESYLGVDVCSE